MNCIIFSNKLFITRHKLKVNKEILLELHRHTLEVQLWFYPSKMTARARYDRPKAFRLPVFSDPDLVKSALGELGRRPSKFPEVSHDQHVRNFKGRSTRAARQQQSLYGTPMEISLQSLQFYEIEGETLSWENYKTCNNVLYKSFGHIFFLNCNFIVMHTFLNSIAD